IARQPVLREEAPRQVEIFRRNTKPPPALGVEGERHIIEIGHGGNIDPALRYGNDHIRMTEAERQQQINIPLRRGKLFANEILARHAEMDLALLELTGDFGG